MSRIFGVFDPGGADPEVVARAARSATGDTLIAEASPSSEVVVGSNPSPGESPGVAREGGHLLVADARIDAHRERDLGSVEGAQAAGILLDVLRGSGPAGLEQLAADFALAWFDAGSRRLLLTRDATANRPLYWARRGSCVAFGSDPRFLLELGLCSGELDEDACARALAGVPRDPQLTGLAGLYRTLGGRWLEVSERGVIARGRWFRPELDPVDAGPSEEAIARIGESIRHAVRDRARSGAVGVSLSGGRDSGSIALALADVGARAECLTMTFDPALCASEDGPARAVAEAAGHGWVGVLQPADEAPADAGWLHRRRLLPLGLPFASSVRANHDAFRARGTRVALEGYGGELFVASPLATGDLVRTGHLSAAVVSARAFRRNWVYGYRTQLKGAARAAAPRSVLHAREARRRLPPWARPGLRGRAVDVALARTARSYRLRFLLWEGTNGVHDDEDAIHYPGGVRMAYPFYDRRVISAALRIPEVALIPEPEPKWPLTDAILGPWSASRVKADQSSWFRAVAGRAWASDEHPAGSGSRIAAHRLVDPRGLTPPYPSPWDVTSAALVSMEGWLRWRAARAADGPWWRIEE